MSGIIPRVAFRATRPLRASGANPGAGAALQEERQKGKDSLQKGAQRDPELYVCTLYSCATPQQIRISRDTQSADNRHNRSSSQSCPELSVWPDGILVETLRPHLPKTQYQRCTIPSPGRLEVTLRTSITPVVTRPRRGEMHRAR